MRWADKELRSAEQYAKQGEWERVKSVLERILAQEPELVGVRYNLAIAYVQLNDPAGAIRHLREIRHEPYASYLLAGAYLLNRDWQNAISEGAVAAAALKQSGQPDLAAQAYSIMGHTYTSLLLETDDIETPLSKGGEAFREALGLSRVPKDQGIFHYSLGFLLFFASDRITSRDLLLRAADEFEQAAALSQEIELFALNQLGLCCTKLGDFERAVHAYEEAIRRGPNTEAIDNLSALLMNQSRWFESRDLLSWAHSHVNFTAELWNKLGIVLTRTGSPEQGEDALRTVLRIETTHPYAYNNLGTALEAQGRLEEARASYEESLQHNADDPNARRNLERLLDVNAAEADLVVDYDTPIGRLSDSQLLDLVALRLAPRHQERLAALLERNSNRTALAPEESRELDELMELADRVLLRKSEAIAEAGKRRLAPAMRS